MRLFLISAASSRDIAVTANCRTEERRNTASLRFAISFPETSSKEPLDGRMLLLISTNNSREPRFQISEDLTTQQVFGIDVDGLKPGQEAIVDADAFGYPVRSLPR